MEKGKPVNLKRYQSPKLGGKMAIRLIVYVVLLGALLVYMNWKAQQTSETKDGTYIEEVKGIQIETSP